jgi:hypothetical protein
MKADDSAFKGKLPEKSTKYAFKPHLTHNGDRPGNAGRRGRKWAKRARNAGKLCQDVPVRDRLPIFRLRLCGPAKPHAEDLN